MKRQGSKQGQGGVGWTGAHAADGTLKFTHILCKSELGAVVSCNLQPHSDWSSGGDVSCFTIELRLSSLHPLISFMITDD